VARAGEDPERALRAACRAAVDKKPVAAIHEVMSHVVAPHHPQRHELAAVASLGIDCEVLR
jgi:hypothetical protein